MKLAINNLTELPWQVRDALEGLEVQIASGWGIQHTGDGTHADITGTSLTVTGALDSCELRVCGPEYINRDGVLQPAALTGNTNNYNPVNVQSAYILKIDSTGAYDVTGLQAPSGGIGLPSDFKRVCFRNVSNFTLTLKHNNASSSTLNRFACPAGADVLVRSSGTVWLQYDSAAGNWIVEGA